MKSLAGRVALVTGAGRGIGRAIAVRLAAEGASVVVNDVDTDVATTVADEIVDANGDALAAPGDVASSADTDRMVATAEASFGTLDLLVNNAGLTRDAWLHRMTDEEWNLIDDVVLRGTFNACRSAARLLRRPGGSSPLHHRKVVNVTSINGIYGAAGNVNYSAAKAGVIGLTKALAREWAPLRINVNAVAPGYIENTRLTAPREEGSSLGIGTEVIRRIEKMIPIGRPGRPEDVAGVVSFLCCEDSDYLTGQVIELHGGLEIIEVVG